MATTKAIGGAAVVSAALLVYLLTRKSGAAGASMPPPPPGSSPPTGGGGYVWPAGFNLRSAVSEIGLLYRMPPWLAPATAIAENGMRFPPAAPNECGGDYGCTFYPMGIKSGTIATALGRGAEFRGNRAAFDGIAFNLPLQIDAAARLLSHLWASAAVIAHSEEATAHLVRVAWQSGTMPNTERLPAWYTQPNRDCGGPPCMQHWTDAVRAAGGGDIGRIPGGAMAGGRFQPPDIALAGGPVRLRRARSSVF